MNVQRSIEQNLQKTFSPLRLDVRDDSDKHAGHAGWKKTGGTHFSVTVVSEKFDGKKPVQRHRLIYEALQNEMKGGVHALAIEAFTPKEWEQRKEGA